MTHIYKKVLFKLHIYEKKFFESTQIIKSHFLKYTVIYENII